MISKSNLPLLSETQPVWASINLLIFHTETRKNFLGLVHVFRHIMGLWKDIVDQFDEVVVTVIREETLRLNCHKLGHESKEGHFRVFMQRLF
jgi:hypothetical protein